MDQPATGASMEEMYRQIQVLAAAINTLQTAAPATAPSPPAVHSSAKPLKPSTFSSVKESGDPVSWLFSVHLYFEAARTPDAQKVPFVATFLRGSAALWWQSIFRGVQQGERQAITTWQEFESEFRQVFSPVDSSKVARDQLRQLTQTKSVSEYTDKFRTLSLQITDLSAAEALDRFTAGLKPPVREKIEIDDPKTLERAMFVAHRVDTIHHRAQQRANNAQPSSATASPVQDNAVPMELGAMRPQQGQQQRRRYPAKLKPGERAHLAAQGRCFRCRGDGHWHANCPLSKPNQQPNQRRW